MVRSTKFKHLLNVFQNQLATNIAKIKEMKLLLISLDKTSSILRMLVED